MRIARAAMIKITPIKQNPTGFNLIELLIVMAITGILTLLAYPSYQNYITRARRSEGQTALIDLATRMEQYDFDHNTYQSATIGKKGPDDILSQPTSPEKGYTLSITHATQNSYTLQATPIGPQGKTDTRCQSLTLDNWGVKGITTGPAGPPTGSQEQCW